MKVFKQPLWFIALFFIFNDLLHTNDWSAELHTDDKGHQARLPYRIDR